MDALALYISIAGFGVVCSDIDVSGRHLTVESATQGSMIVPIVQQKPTFVPTDRLMSC